MKLIKVLPLIFIFILALGCGLAKKSESYKMSMELVKNDTRVKDFIGEIKGDGSVSSFNISTKGTSGNAEFKIKVKGSKQTGTLFTKLTKSADQWKFDSAKLTTADGKTIDLLQKSQLASGQLRVTDSYFAKEKWGRRIDNPSFNKGEIVYYHVIARGLKKQPDGQYSFAADLKVLRPDSSVYLIRDNIILGQQELPNDELPLVFNVTMGDDAEEGNYGVLVLVKDNEGGQMVSSSKKYDYKR